MAKRPAGRRVGRLADGDAVALAELQALEQAQLEVRLVDRDHGVVDARQVVGVDLRPQAGQRLVQHARCRGVVDGRVDRLGRHGDVEAVPGPRALAVDVAQRDLDLGVARRLADLLGDLGHEGRDRRVRVADRRRHGDDAGLRVERALGRAGRVELELRVGHLEDPGPAGHADEQVRGQPRRQLGVELGRRVGHRQPGEVDAAGGDAGADVRQLGARGSGERERGEQGKSDQAPHRTDEGSDALRDHAQCALRGAAALATRRRSARARPGAPPRRARRRSRCRG